MRIDELDEFQGLTADMMREWLKARAPRVTLETDGWWQWVDLRVHVRDSHLTTNPAQAISDIAFCERLSVQALLREINPRWRKGFPSTAALSEHDEWLIRVPWGAEFVAHISYGGSDDGYMILIPPDSESGDCGGIAESVWEDCFYWPCDGNANRVRWPVDAEGNML